MFYIPMCSRQSRPCCCWIVYSQTVRGAIILVSFSGQKYSFWTVKHHWLVRKASSAQRLMPVRRHRTVESSMFSSTAASPSFSHRRIVISEPVWMRILSIKTSQCSVNLVPDTCCSPNVKYSVKLDWLRRQDLVPRSTPDPGSEIGHLVLSLICTTCWTPLTFSTVHGTIIYYENQCEHVCLW